MTNEDGPVLYSALIEDGITPLRLEVENRLTNAVRREALRVDDAMRKAYAIGVRDGFTQGLMAASEQLRPSGAQDGI